MSRMVSAFVLLGLLSLVAAVAPRPAAAGDYYYDDSYRDDSYRYSRRYRDDSYRYSRPYRDYSYRDDDDWSYRSHRRYERRYDDEYERPYYRPSYRRYSYRSYSDDSSYVMPRYYESSRRSYGYDDYAEQPRRLYSEGCYPRKVKLYDDGGGWVWGTRTVCN